MGQRYTAKQIRDAIVETKGVLARAARKLGCSDATVRNYVRRYELEDELTKARGGKTYSQGRKPRYTVEEVREAILKARGVLSEAARALECTRQSLQGYVKKFPELADILTDAREHSLDVAEHALMSQIDRGNIAAIIFYLKCQGKARGYVERQEIHHSGGITAEQIPWDKLTDEQLERLEQGEPAEKVVEPHLLH